MKTLVKLAAIAACFIGLQVSSVSAEVRKGERNKSHGAETGFSSILFATPDTNRNDIWVVDTGDGYTEVEWTYLMMLDLGLTEYEAMVLLGDEAIAIPNLMSADEPYVDSIAIPNLLRGERAAIAIPAF